MRPISAQSSIAIVCLVLGIMLSVQFQTTRYYKGTNVPERAEDLTIQIKTVSKEKEALEQKADALIVQLNNSTNYNQAMADLQKEVQIANLAAGFVSVEGPGIIITVNDNPNLKPGDDPNGYLIHDNDLLQLTNELKAAGAEAISINNQRITAMSEIRCAGPLTNVNGVKTGPPYVLKAIGNPDVLYGMMKSKNGYLEILNMYELKTSIDKFDNVSIPALKRQKSLLRSV